MSSRKQDKDRKLVTVGDGGCGKTCLLTVYSEGRFPEDYVPTVFETSIKTVPHPYDTSRNVSLTLWDTAGQEDFDRLRPLSYHDTNVVIIVFAINHRVSLANVQDKWFPEVAHFMETVPIILVGTKLDLRTERTELSLMASQGQQPVQTAEGEQVAREIGAKRYLECSAKTRFGVQEVFDAALKETFSKGALLDGWKANNGPASSTRKRKCVLL